MRARMQTRLFVLAALALAACAQPRHPVSGRVYAGVMGVGGAPWLDRPEREAEERPSLAVSLLDVKPGMTVADLGAGSGFYTGLLAPKVLPGGKVLAADLQPGMLDILRRRMREQKIENVETILSSPSDPRLPEACCDLVLMVDVYHELAEPQAVLRKIRTALKPGGRLVLIEFRKEDPNVPIRAEHKMSIAEVRAELEPEAFQFVKVLNDLPWQHLLIFRK